MKRYRIARRWMFALAAAGLAGLMLAAVTAAGDLDPVMSAGEEKIQLAQSSQDRIDDVVQETRDLEARYVQLMKEGDGLEVYNDYMERQVGNQLDEIEELRASIDQVSTVERQIMPLMIRMIEGLERFVQLDIPFLYKERVERIANLKILMERADISVAEKFRSLTEAFQIENDFGRTIEAYQGTLVIEGATLEVSLLRLGRIGLYYQTSDAGMTGRWNPSTRDWEILGGSKARNQVRQGLKMARKQVAPDLLLLPVEAPEVAK